MATAKRQSDSSLEKRLFEEFYRFSFYRAVRHIERLGHGKKMLGATLDPKKEPVRFCVKPGLAFPPSDISKLDKPEGSEPARMEVRFIGLIGPSGVLPYWFNDLALARLQAKDHTLVDFLDIFHHRLITLFYLAWKRYDFPVNYLPGANDSLSHYLLCLVGLGTPGLRGKIGLPEESLLYLSGLLARHVPTAAAVEAAVRYMAGGKAEVHQFIERMIPLEPEDCTQIGLANALLGESTICCKFAWECGSKFRIHLGPFTYKHFTRFLPNGDLLKPIFALVRYLVGVEYEFEIRIFLNAAEVPGYMLGGVAGSASPRLGWSTWVFSTGLRIKEDPYVTFQEGDLK
jgi:type VI secretion system protein ImpH